MYLTISSLAKSILLTVLFLLISLSLSATACNLNSETLATIQNNEIRYLEARIPPAFKHALEDKQFKLTTTSSENCMVSMQAFIDASALIEANQSLEENPAKRIMLSSQGYSLPESETMQYSFKVDDNLQALHAETLQTSELGKARASIEMVYSILSQNRAARVSETHQNTLPWSKAYKDKFTDQCVRAQKSNLDNSSTCECRAKTFAEHLNEREMEYSEYIRSNPYAKATGADKGFSALEQNVMLSCGK